MCQEKPVILDNKVLDSIRTIENKVSTKEEERNSGSLTPKN
jgi:hypothetical protein